MGNGWWRAGLWCGLFGYVVRMWDTAFVLWSDVVNWCSIVVHFVLLFRFSQCKTEWYTPLCWLKVEGWKLKVSKKFLFRENWIFLNELSDNTEYAILSQSWILMEIVLELLPISLPSAEILWILRNVVEKIDSVNLNGYSTT